jgi:hypothetical protein
MVLSLLVFAATATAESKEKPWEAPVPSGIRALDCTNAIPINCGDVVQGSNVGLPNNVDYYSCVGWQETGGEVVYEFVIPQGVCYTVTIVLSNYTGDPDWFLLSACDENECVAYGDVSGTTVCLNPGTYYLVVDGYSYNPTVTYTLSVSCTECECPVPPCCPSLYHTDIFDFNIQDYGFQTQICNGTQVWQWGALSYSSVPPIACDNVYVTNVLGTVVNGNYVAYSGDIAMIGPVDITPGSWCMELCHFYDTEARFDGGNVKVSTDGGATWTLITPARLYDNTTYSACRCIPLEPAFTGHQFNTTWLRDCFTLTDFIGQQVWIGFFFGSDGSVQYPGWYIKWVKFGSNEPTSTEESTWGNIKSMFR